MAKHEDIRWDYWVGDYWTKRRAVEPWQACALSLHIEPNSMTADHKSYSDGPFVKGMWEPEQKIGTLGEFERRLSLLYQDKDDPRLFTLRSDGKLLLHEVVAWMKEKKIYDFPWELARLDAKPIELADMNDARAALEASEADTYGDLRTSALETSLANKSVVDIPSNSKPAMKIAVGRRDALAPAIDKAISSAGGDNAAVYLALKELALAGEPPFSGRVKEGGALEYTDSNNKLRRISRDALSKRISRRQTPRTAVRHR